MGNDLFIIFVSSSFSAAVLGSLASSGRGHIELKKLGACRIRLPSTQGSPYLYFIATQGTATAPCLLCVPVLEGNTK